MREKTQHLGFLISQVVGVVCGDTFVFEADGTAN